MPVRTALRAAIPAMVLGVCLSGCSLLKSTPEPDADAAGRPAASADAAEATAGGTGAEAGEPAPSEVRDAFAGLQATLDETCTPGAGDCAYFLGRVDDELDRLDEAMKADPQGPEHFKEPLAWIATLNTALDGDPSAPNLEKHKDDLVGTRDRVNTWMQDHPEDYR
ncbi:hypothetical protein [Streptomyces sp. NRRL WC-3549]|uniref:hypothetical protein n=1 Tax=Streptomyces sp. NRRL WC-3549 TaxID=1463925 RepID=UPI0009E7FA66|nr:hypothetical protein [Streptomyces sp. NRRL WC-3549]